MFKIAICDDVEDVCSELKTMIIDMKDSLICGDIIIDTFYSGEALLENIEESPYDLIFLDIELGGDKRGRGRTYYSWTNVDLGIDLEHFITINHTTYCIFRIE